MTIGIGIIGCGRILPAHLRGFRELRDHGVDSFRITSLCARHIEDAQMFRKRGEGPPPRQPVTSQTWDPLSAPHSYVSDFQPNDLPSVYSDYHALIADRNVDAVVVLTAVDSHHGIALAALDAGKHVIVEKPLAITVRAARRMVESARTNELVIATAEVARYQPEVRAAWWTVSSGQIGRLQAVIGGGIGAGDWSPNQIVAKTPWRHQKLRAGGGPVVDFGPHRFDVVRYVGGEIVEVSGLIQTLEPIRVVRDASGAIIQRVDNEVEDLFFASFRFAHGAVGQINFCWGGHGKQVNLPISYFGEQGSLIGTQLTRDDGSRFDIVEKFDTEADALTRNRFFPLGLQDGFALELYNWLEAIRQAEEPETSGREGLRDLAVSYAVIESWTARRWIAVDEVEAGIVDAYQRELDQYFGLV